LKKKGKAILLVGRGWILNIFSSVKKTFELKKVAKSIANPKPVTVDDLLSDKPSDTEQLFDLVYKYDDLKAVVEEYSADREVLHDIFNRLVAHGACQWKKGDYVLVSTFGFTQTLNYILRNYYKENTDWYKVTLSLVNHFENGKTEVVKV
jgi:hypothetical protein